MVSEMPTSGGKVPPAMVLLVILGMALVQPAVDTASVIGACVSFGTDFLLEVPDLVLALLAPIGVDGASDGAFGVAFFLREVRFGDFLAS